MFRVTIHALALSIFKLLWLVFLVVTPLVTRAAEGSEVVGTVREARGTTLEGATVYLAKGQDCLTTTVDGNGRFAFAGVKPAVYDYLAVSVPPDGKRFPFCSPVRALT